MAQLVLGVAGAVVGSFFGMPQVGWMIGSALGGALSQPDGQTSEGPRLGDLSVQASTYGTMVPIVFGSMRVNGNVIFCTDKREVTTTTEEGGKGGPSATTTTYSYNVDIAISLCANTIAGIRKIWSNGKLIYDQSTGADLATAISSSTRSAGFKIYLGTETQLPDPTIEAGLGLGNVPAYRGTAYVVFAAMDCPNGQIPQLSFEVVQNSSGTAFVSVGTSQSIVSSVGPMPITAVTITGGPTPVFTRVSDVNPLPFSFKINGLGANYLSVIGNVRANQPSIPSPIISGNSDQPIQFILETDSAGSQFTGNLVAYGVSGESARKFYVYGEKIDLGNITNVQNFAKFGNRLALFFSGSPPRVLIFDWDTSLLLVEYADQDLLATNYLITENLFWFFPISVGIRSVQIHDLRTMALMSKTSLPSNLGGAYNPLQTSTLGGDVVDAVVSAGGTGIWLYQISASGASTLVAYDAGTADRKEWVDDIAVQKNQILVRGLSVYGVRVSGTLPTKYVTPFSYNFSSVTSVAIPVATVIADICARAGVPAGKLDTSSVTDTVQGYALTNVSSARANIDPLLTAFFIDVLKTDGKIKFRPRAGLTSVATIAFDELGAADAGSDPDAPMSLERTLEDDLPRSLAVSFINPAADYQVGTETFRRIITSSINDQTMQLAIVMDSNRAASIANALVFDAWAQRNTRKLKLQRRYAALDAGDVITVEFPIGRFTPKRITRASDTGRTCDLDLVDYDGGIYSVAALGSISTAVQSGISLPAPSRLEVLDIPILRDADNDPGLYVAIAALSTNWSGATLFMGTDDASLSPRGSVAASAVMGFADGKLGDWTQHSMDQTNTVLVTLGAGSLSNAPRDDVLNNNVNAALLGSEIIGFTSATLVAGTQYRLSGLLRGARGTEGETGRHAQGERFVLLRTTGMLRPVFDLSELNSPRQLRAITAGLNLSSQTSIPASNTGRGLKPHSPVNLRRSAAANDITLTWDRRTRSSVTFPVNGVDVPLFEASESYLIDIYGTSGFVTVLRTLSSGTPTVTYTSAQQTTDGLTPGAVINARVFQIGAAGRGNYLQGTL